jgi:hypothetical protein
MTDVTTLPLLVRRGGGRRYMSIYQGALISGLCVVWRCGHWHDVKLDAQQCANHEASYRSIPLSARDELEEVCH